MLRLGQIENGWGLPPASTRSAAVPGASLPEEARKRQAGPAPKHRARCLLVRSACRTQPRTSLLWLRCEGIRSWVAGITTEMRDFRICGAEGRYSGIV